MRFWIQQGHVPRTTGSTGTAGEQDYVKRVAQDAKLLIGDRHTVRLAGADEPLPAGYDLFVSLHCDGSVSSSASGASVGYRGTFRGSRAAAHLWKRRFTARGWPFGFRDDNYTSALGRYYGTGWSDARGIPGFILEHGFLTNHARDARWLKSSAGRVAAAQALADVMMIYAGGRPVANGDDLTEEDDMGTLARGMQDAGVGDLQDDLNALASTLVAHGLGGRGEPLEAPPWFPLTVDDDYGKATDAAVGWAKSILGYKRPGSGGRYAPEGFQRRLAVLAYGNPADARAERRADSQWSFISELRDKVDALEGERPT